MTESKKYLKSFGSRAYGFGGNVMPTREWFNRKVNEKENVSWDKRK